MKKISLLIDSIFANKIFRFVVIILIALPAWYFWGDEGRRKELGKEVETSVMTESEKVGEVLKDSAKKSKDAISSWWGSISNEVEKTYDETIKSISK